VACIQKIGSKQGVEPMSVSAISSSNALNQANMLQNASQQPGTQFQQLTQALQTGNLSNAQQLFSALNSSAASSGLLSTQMKQDLSKLGSALQSGNLTGARQAYSARLGDGGRAGRRRGDGKGPGCAARRGGNYSGRCCQLEWRLSLEVGTVPVTLTGAPQDAPLRIPLQSMRPPF